MTENVIEDGVQFAAQQGRRSSQRAGKRVFADAARAVDADLATRIERTNDWRKSYIPLVGDLVAAGARSGKDALRIAADGLDALGHELTFLRSGDERPLPNAFADAGERFATRIIDGTGARARSIAVPYKGKTLEGDALLAQLDRWADAGALEPSARDAVALVVRNADWLDLSDRWFALLGAASEMGPLEPLCAWGANVIAVDQPRPYLWEHIARVARAGAGKLHLPAETTEAADPIDGAGTDLITHAPEVHTWLASFEQSFTLGNYVYADGATFVRLAGVVDALVASLLSTRSDLSLSYLATPTDVFAVPEEVVDKAGNGRGSIVARVMRPISGSRLYAPNYRRIIAGENARRWGLSDSLVPIQGPNYALAKSLQRWRAVLAREEGTVTSANVAPASNTRSVVKNKMLAAAYRGAPSFGVEIFEPATTRVLMAALLVHDLRNPSAPAHPDVQLDHPYDLFVQGAVHGGIWTLGYQPRSILPLGLAKGLVKRG